VNALRIRHVKRLKTISMKFAIHCQEHRLVVSSLPVCGFAALPSAPPRPP